MQGSKRWYVRMRRLYLIIQAQARMDSLQIHEILLRWLARRKTRWCCSKTDDRLNWSIICMPRKLERSIFLGNRFRLNFSTILKCIWDVLSMYSPLSLSSYSFDYDLQWCKSRYFSFLGFSFWHELESFLPRDDKGDTFPRFVFWS